MDVDSIADELYGLPPAEFTAARDARSADARRNGDRPLANAIKTLGRPTTGAWLANLLVRERTQQVGQLLDLGAAMREAQAELAGGQMRELAGQRRAIVSALGREAGQLASDRGQPVSRAIREEMEGTLEAALADPGAGEALRSGRLTASLRYTGLGVVDVGRAVARVEAAEQRLRDARTEAAEAKRTMEERERTVREVQERVDGLGRQLDGLEQQMRRLRGEESFATKNLREAERASASAGDTLRRAKQKVKEAES